MTEMKEAIETDRDGSIYIAKPSVSSSTPPVSPSSGTEEQPKNASLAEKDSLALPFKKRDQDYNEEDDDVVSLELLTVVDSRQSDTTKERIQSFCTKRMLLLWLFGLFLLILAIVLPIVLNTDNNEMYVGDKGGNGIDFVSGGNADTTAYQVLEPIVSNPDALLDPSTPEGMAFQTVQAEDNPFYIQQQYALQTIYYSTQGESWVFTHGWDSWSWTDEELCQWASITICRNLGDGRIAVAGLDLDSNNLQGPIPEDICLLQSLERVNFSNNQLTGKVPACLATLPNLVALEIQGNPGLDSDAISDPSFCDDDRSWEIFTSDCLSVDCNCCTSCS